MGLLGSKPRQPPEEPDPTAATRERRDRITVMLAGRSGVGKTSLLRRVREDRFAENEFVSIGMDFWVGALVVGRAGGSMYWSAGGSLGR